MILLLALVVLVLVFGVGTIAEFALWSIFVIALGIVVAGALTVGQLRGRR